MNILANSKNYRLGGRYLRQGETIFLSYSASFIEFRFKGKKAVAKLMSNGYDDTDLFYGWVSVFVDNCDKPSKHFPVMKGSAEYVLYEASIDANDASATEVSDDDFSAMEDLPETTIRIMKCSETVFGDVGIEAIEVDGEVIPMEPSYKKLMEIVGDSITCGYGFHGICDKDVFTTAHENPWDNYAGKVARRLGIDYQLVSWSGNGVVSHYMDATADTPRVENFFLQDLYPFADAEFERKMGITEFTPWSFDRKADLVIINLGTNDSTFTAREERKNAMFAENYKKLIAMVRENNPDANILCILGVMIQCLTDEIEKIVAELNAAGDKKIFFKEVPLQSEADGYATDGHPSPITHEKMSLLLCDYITEKHLV